MKNKKRVLVSLSFALVLGLSSCCYDCEKEEPILVNGVEAGSILLEQQVCGKKGVREFEKQGYKCTR